MNATKLGIKKIHTIIYHYMTYCGYIIMIIVYPYMIWFHLDYIMQLK